MATITGYHHVAFTVTDVEKSLAAILRAAQSA